MQNNTKTTSSFTHQLSLQTNTPDKSKWEKVHILKASNHSMNESGVGSKWLLFTSYSARIRIYNLPTRKPFMSQTS
jgi:hypothetical protein